MGVWGYSFSLWGWSHANKAEEHMTRNVSLHDLLRQKQEREVERKRLEQEIARLTQAIAFLSEFSATEPQRHRRTPAKTRASRHARRPPQIIMDIGGSEKPTVRDALFALLRASPGMKASEAIDRLKGQTSSVAGDQRKLVSTRIGQFIRKEWVRRDGDRLYLTEKVG